MKLDPKTVAAALGGEIVKGQVRAPGPNHSPSDRSLSVKIDDAAPDGFLVNSFADDDPIWCKDYVRLKLGLADFKPNGANGSHPVRRSEDAIAKAMASAVSAPIAPKKGKGVVLAKYDYTDENGELLYQVVRYEPKDFSQRRPDGKGGWIADAGDRKVLYRWPELLEFPDATIFVCEGEKDADRVASLGHCATTVASGEWAQDCVKALASRDCLILEDNDKPGRKKALNAAAELQGIAKTIRIVRLPDLKVGGDVSDWLDADPRRADKLVDICFDAPLWEPEAKASDPGQDKGKQQSHSTGSNFEPLPLIFCSDIKEAARKDWNIKNVMARGEISSWFGPPGGGKSASLTDIVIAGARCSLWRGYRIKENFASIYFALERGDLVKRRIVAHRLRDDLPEDLPIAISNAVVDVMNRSCVDLILDAIKRAEDYFGLAVREAIFDTWSKAMGAGGGDEQQAKDQNIALANMRRILQKVNIHIATIGHTGKDEAKGERGSNAKKADVDLEVQFSGETIKSAVVTKANDQPLGLLTSFQLEPFDFGPDEDGDPFRTYIVAKEAISGAAAATKQTLTDHQQLALEALAEASLKHGAELPPHYQMPAGLKSVTEDQWLEEMHVLKVIDRKAKNPRSRLNELRGRLQIKRLIGVRDERVWLAKIDPNVTGSSLRTQSA